MSLDDRWVSASWPFLTHREAKSRLTVTGKVGPGTQISVKWISSAACPETVLTASYTSGSNSPHDTDAHN